MSNKKVSCVIFLLLMLTVLTAKTASYSALTAVSPVPDSISIQNATQLIKAYAATYKVEAKASGELQKEISYQGKKVTLASTLKVSKMFINIIINQQEEGVLSNKGLVASSLVINNSRKDGPKTINFKSGQMGNLSAIYTLRYSLLSKEKSLPAINMLLKNKFERLNFSIIAKNRKVSTALGDISSTQLSATTSNGDVISYWFANKNQKLNGVMVKMSEVSKNGDSVLLAVISKYKQVKKH